MARRRRSHLAAALDALACFGIAPGGDPAQPTSAAELVALRDEATARLAASQAAPDDPAALFGRASRCSRSPRRPSGSAGGGARRRPARRRPADVLAPLGGSGARSTSWVETHGRVRPGVGRLADVLLAARLRDTGGPSQLRAIQQPRRAVPDGGCRPPRAVGRAAFPGPARPGPGHQPRRARPRRPRRGRGIAVLVVDEFVEVVPARDTTTALSFGFDAPGARPPQTILLAVPPVPARPGRSTASRR